MKEILKFKKYVLFSKNYVVILAGYVKDVQTRLAAEIIICTPSLNFNPVSTRKFCSIYYFTSSSEAVLFFSRNGLVLMGERYVCVEDV
uniref:Uncharacterized protein n=1 Tax=Solanum lycopersicum TaxID=4081 RepID=A0A3Q7FVB0_SOLLC